MPMSPEAIEEFKGLIATARKRQVNFGLCLGKKPENTVFVGHRMKGAGMLVKLARKEGETMKLAAGSMKVKGKKMLLTCEDEVASGMARLTKKFLVGLGLKFKVQFLDAAGGLMDDDGDPEEGEEDQGEAGADGAQPGNDAGRQKWEAAQARVAPLVQAAGSDGGTSGDKIRSLWEFARNKAGGGEFATAIKTLAAITKLTAEARAGTGNGAAAAAEDPAGGADGGPTLERLRALGAALKAAVQANPGQKDALLSAAAQIKADAESGEADRIAKSGSEVERLGKLLARLAEAGGSGGVSVARLGRARLEWRNVRETAVRDMARLKTAIGRQYEGLDELKAEVDRATRRLDQTFQRLNGTLDDQLDAVLNEADPARRRTLADTARQTMKNFLGYVDSDPVMAELDGNEVLPDLAITGPIKTSLGQISAALG